MGAADAGLKDSVTCLRIAQTPSDSLLKPVADKDLVSMRTFASYIWKLLLSLKSSDA